MEYVLTNSDEYQTRDDHQRTQKFDKALESSSSLVPMKHRHSPLSHRAACATIFTTSPLSRKRASAEGAIPCYIFRASSSLGSRTLQKLDLRSKTNLAKSDPILQVVVRVTSASNGNFSTFFIYSLLRCYIAP